MLILTAIALLTGLVIPPGATRTVCRTSPAGFSHGAAGPHALDDTLVDLGGRWGVTINLGNFDSDPELEIACRLSLPAPGNPGLSVSKLVVLDNDLAVMWQDSWGYSGNPEMASVTIADIDDDGRDDIIIPFAETFFESAPLYKGRVYVLDGATGATKPGWPFILPGWPEDPYHDTHSEVAVADLDGDGRLEVICQVADLGSIRKPGAGLYALKANGDSLWKHLFWTDTLDRHGAYTSPAVADLDGDGMVEIICHAGHFQRAYPYPVIEKRLFILNGDGTVRRSWQTEGPGGAYSPDYASPAVGDLDGDGIPEIIVARRGGWLDCYDTLGTMLPGFPIDLHTDAGYYPPTREITRAFATPALADLGGDARPEIIVGTSGREACNTRWAGRIHAFKTDGGPIHGFPVPTRNAIWYSPAAGNVDADPAPEILTAGCDSTFYVVDASGSPLPGWPVTDFPTYWLPDRGSYAFLEGIIPMSRTPYLVDLDSDGFVEILVSGSDGTFQLWRTEGRSDPVGLPCPTFRFDKERTGWYRPPQAATAGPAPRPVAGPMLFGPTVRRPGPVRVRLSRSLTAAPVALVRDAAGRLLRRLPTSLTHPDGRTLRLDLAGFAAGVVFVEIDGLVGTLRVVLVD
ncbi:MAG: VCBS repeat-containing protein [bacterium]